ncbi:hypothetical protein [Hymenobacter elongatus]|uniref:Uncharacterized protein n=1 Tax=Hymenobacter elongatus TaxID=877208 RepID=A0A4Z0PF33_9BACT|nr:hypothetical protein [Hymenobacter elongatus]TGE12852.1 hypothetical protein E5J99_19845 [Hymenobacter elongatus]
MDRYSLGPEHALRAHLVLRGALLLPLRWGTFNMAFHSWTESMGRLQAAAALQVPAALLLPRPGQRMDVEDGAYSAEWWR